MSSAGPAGPSPPSRQRARRGRAPRGCRCRSAARSRRRASRAATAAERSTSPLVADRLGSRGDELLGARRDVLVVGVGLVQLEHRELGVVLLRDALVAEVLAELVDALQPADDAALEVQLGRDPQEQRAVERVVVGRERPRRGAAVERLQHRRLDLDEALLVEVAADRRDRLRAREEQRCGSPRRRSGRARGGGSASRRPAGRGASPAAGAATSRAASSPRRAATARRGVSRRRRRRSRSGRRGRARRAARSARRPARRRVRAAGSGRSGRRGR